MTVINMVMVILPLLFLFKQLTTINYSNNYQLFSQFLSLIFATSLINTKEQQINRVSINLQVETPHFAVSSFQIRIIANTARHIAYIANCNLSNFISLFIFDYYLQNCVQYQQHEHLEKINEKPEHYVAKTSIITEESVKPSTIRAESVGPSVSK